MQRRAARRLVEVGIALKIGLLAVGVSLPDPADDLAGRLSGV
jgi:hypothetical protein